MEDQDNSIQNNENETNLLPEQSELVDGGFGEPATTETPILETTPEEIGTAKSEAEQAYINEDAGSYPLMSEENKAFLVLTKNMYDIQEADPRFTEVGQIITDLPGLPNFIIKHRVYSPEHVPVAMAWPKWIAEHSKDKSFLEIGTGTGIAAVYVALHGEPTKVVATDIAPAAVENCRANAEQYHLEEPYFKTIESDVFNSIPKGEKFDLMFWNFPWNAPDKEIEEILADEGKEATPEKVMQLKAGLDTKYKALRRFIQEAGEYLNKGGEILLGAGEPARHDIICGEAKMCGYKIEVAAEQEMKVDIINRPNLKVMLYRLTK